MLGQLYQTGMPVVMLRAAGGGCRVPDDLFGEADRGAAQEEKPVHATQQGKGMLLVLNAKATARLRQAGYHVGLLGATR